MAFNIRQLKKRGVGKKVQARLADSQPTPARPLRIDSIESEIGNRGSGRLGKVKRVNFGSKLIRGVS
jgi:hypothetical protein